MLGIMDLIMVGKLGAVAIAGVGTALQIMFIVLAALAAVAIGTTVLVARAIGANQPGEAAHAIKQSLVLDVVLAAIIAALGHIFAHPIIALLGATPPVVRAGGDYLDIVSVTSVVLVIQLVCSSARLLGRVARGGRHTYAHDRDRPGQHREHRGGLRPHFRPLRPACPRRGRVRLGR